MIEIDEINRMVIENRKSKNHTYFSFKFIKTNKIHKIQTEPKENSK